MTFLQVIRFSYKNLKTNNNKQTYTYDKAIHLDKTGVDIDRIVAPTKAFFYAILKVHKHLKTS